MRQTLGRVGARGRAGMAAVGLWLALSAGAAAQPASPPTSQKMVLVELFTSHG